MQEALKRDPAALHAAFQAFNLWLDEDWGFDRGDGRLYAAPMITLADPALAAPRRSGGCWPPAPGSWSWCPVRCPPATATCPRATPASTPCGRSWPRPACPSPSTPGSAAWPSTASSGAPAATAAAGGFEGFKHAAFPLVAFQDRGISDTFAALICHGVLTRFPNLRLASIENGAMWVPDLLRNLGDGHGKMPFAFDEHPVEQFTRCVWVAPYYEDDMAHAQGQDRGRPAALRLRLPATRRACPSPPTYVKDIPTFDRRRGPHRDARQRARAHHPSPVTGPTPGAVDGDVADELVATVRRWVDAEVIPHASALEHADDYPADDGRPDRRPSGCSASRSPPSTAGLGLDLTTYAGVIEELAAGWMSLVGCAQHAHHVAANLIDRYGTDEQREDARCPACATARSGARLSLSEPDAGSDSGAMRAGPGATATSTGITGTKMWVTNGQRAALVDARWPAPDEGITASWSRRSPEPTVRGHHRRRSDREARLQGHRDRRDDLRRPSRAADSVLGGDEGLGQGQHYILSALEVGRINIAARCRGRRPGRPRAAALAYATSGETFGKPIAEHQAIAVQARRHGDQAPGRPPPDLRRRPPLRGRRAHRRRSRHGQAVRLRGRLRDRDRGAAHPRRHRLHPGATTWSATSATPR